MSKTISAKFLRDSGADVFNGNELIVKGALETEGGVHLMTGYPGSPVATFFDVLAQCSPLLKSHGIEARIANNEALSVAALNGLQMAPLRGMSVFKSVGLNVASDALSIANLAGAHPEGGAIVVVGDDPWCDTTQVPADSRFLCKHMFVPALEPSTAQEMKDYVDAAFKLSRRSGLYIAYIVTSTLADGGGTVICKPNHYPLTSANHPIELETSTLKLEDTVLLPPRTGRREVELAERFDRLLRAIDELQLNELHDVPGANEVLIVTSGLAYQYVEQVLGDFELSGAVPVLKLGVTYPLDRRRFEALLRRFEHVVVIEERRSFIESQIAEIAVKLDASPRGRIARIWGKQFPNDASGFPSALGLNVSIVADRFARFLRMIESPLARRALRGIDAELRVIADTAKVDVALPDRSPTFCPGCPHRDSSNVLLQTKKEFLDPEYMRRRHKRAPIDLVFHGDAGCYTMLMFEPNVPLMHNYSGMGLGGGTGSGIDPFISNKQVVFMGDGTFFHSGSVAISNSISGRQDITYIILANGTIAMTGHQPLPAVETDLLDRPIQAQDIEQIVRSLLGPTGTVVRVNPEQREDYKRVLEETILSSGTKVIIADKECGITYHRRKLKDERRVQKEQGFLPRKVYMNVTQEVCENCLECTTLTGCPGLTTIATDHGPKVQTDLSWCVNDQACARLDACPSFEEVIVTRKNPPTPRGHMMELRDLPEPAQREDWKHWRAYIAGIGGMGIGTATAILVNGAQHAGYPVKFSDKKGLAIRNGGVYSQVVISRGTGAEFESAFSPSMTLGYGKADLLLGLDLLEAVRAADCKTQIRVVAPDRTAVVVNTDRTPTIETLMGRGDIDVPGMEDTLRRASRTGRYYSARISSLCERIFGTKLYANITMLGVAYQLGLIPLSLESLKEGIRKTVRADFEKNLRAFDLGRKLVVQPEMFADRQPRATLARTVREKAAYLNMAVMGTRRALRETAPNSKRRHRLPDTRLARKYKHLVYTTLRACRELDRETMNDIAIRIYDLIQWGGIEYARGYVARIRRVFLTDDERQGFKATRAVVWNLAKLMLIKDEFYVAYLLTSYEKVRRDRQRYNVNPANGDRIRYRRTFHPRFFGRKVNIRIPHATLYLLRNFGFLRKIMPFYHREDRELLAWYEALADGFACEGGAAYQHYLEALRSPESITGYAEIRHLKIEAARSRVQHLLSLLKKGDPQPRRSAAGPG